jgi:lysyl-tRNA synthetase class 1
MFESIEPADRHWADRAAEQVASRGVQAPVVCTGISPSGQFHIGHLREILTGDALTRALVDSGVSARLVFVVDNLDPLRKVYPFLDPAVFAARIGHSLCELPAPSGAGTYDEFFLAPFLEALDQLRVRAEVLRADRMYASGVMDQVIFTALEATSTLAAVLQEITGAESKPGWSPWNPRCTACRRLDQGQVLGWDRQAGTIHSRCAACQSESIQPARTGGKLTWRVDWPARWKALGVSAEPFGKDHASKGGSYDTGVAICERVFHCEPPFPLVYEWIALKGQGDMSSSKGNVLSAAELLQMIPAEVVRYLVMKTRPGRGISFDPGLPLLKLVDEVDDRAASDRDDRALELSRAAGFKPVGVPYKHLVLVAQIAQFDLDRTLAILEQNGYRDLDREAVADRIARARVWVERFAPEDQRVVVPATLPDAARQLAPEQKSFLKDLAATVRPLEDGEAIHNAIFARAQGPDGIGTKRAFEAVYRSLLGRDKGPRAGAFIAFLGPGWVADRFEAASQS